MTFIRHLFHDRPDVPSMTDTELTNAGAKTDGASRRNLATPAMILALWWTLLWLATWAGNQGWLPMPQFIGNLLFLVGLLGGLGLVLWFAVLIVVRLVQRKLTFTHVLPLIVVLVATFLGFRIPSKPAVMFSRHRQEFIGINRAAIDRFEDTGDHFLPESDLYQSAWVGKVGVDVATVAVRYVLGDFDLELIYVDSDRPEVLVNTCSDGGAVIDRLEPHWYVCSPAWN